MDSTILASIITGLFSFFSGLLVMLNSSRQKDAQIAALEKQNDWLVSLIVTVSGGDEGIKGMRNELGRKLREG